MVGKMVAGKEIQPIPVRLRNEELTRLWYQKTLKIIVSSLNQTLKRFRNSVHLCVLQIFLVACKEEVVNSWHRCTYSSNWRVYPTLSDLRFYGRKVKDLLGYGVPEHALLSISSKNLLNRQCCLATVWWTKQFYSRQQFLANYYACAAIN